MDGRRGVGNTGAAVKDSLPRFSAKERFYPRNLRVCLGVLGNRSSGAKDSSLTVCFEGTQKIGFRAPGVGLVQASPAQTQLVG
ncbi:hypothetical protein NHX12_025019 [Muraenolepis orangiensis]|uniref:Uncharacterized protein n=1 Tax=Muraenolepis orangiensis TaxID=630683 RepID=A0A9Q0EM05_9TELE|nr:hypothetical protein NHX12_025019 [Muraenolepis orangiensis]